MKLLVAVPLTAFVLSFVLGGEDECVGEGLQVCLDILRIDANSDEEECGVVRSSVECIRDIVKECLCDERVKELNIGIERLEKLSNKLCQTKEEKIPSMSNTNCMKMPLFSAPNLLDDGESNCTEKANGCLRQSASKFRSKEESCREINSAINCLVELGKECLDITGDYYWKIIDLEKLFVRRCEREEDIVECPELLTEDFGILYSTRFPRNRWGLMDCYTRIEGKEDGVIGIKIDWMGVYSEDNCTSDYLEIIYDNSSNKIKHFLDETDRCKDVYVSTTRNSVLIHFHSEDPINDMGYKVVYTSMGESHSPAVLGFNNKSKKHFPKCVQENADFILGCITLYTDTIQAATLIENEGYNMRYKKCASYRYMADCFVERTLKKCDEEDVLWANSTISDLLKSDPGSKRCIGHEWFEGLAL